MRTQNLEMSGAVSETLSYIPNLLPIGLSSYPLSRLHGFSNLPPEKVYKAVLAELQNQGAVCTGNTEKMKIKGKLAGREGVDFRVYFYLLDETDTTEYKMLVEFNRRSGCAFEGHGLYTRTFSPLAHMITFDERHLRALERRAKTEQITAEWMANNS